VPDTTTTVTALLAAAGIAPDADEVEILIAGYPTRRASANLLYTVPGLAAASPALAFSLAAFAPTD
jgi:hypothetical protein